jgi:hypothetical protein
MMAAVLSYGSPATAADPTVPPDFSLDFAAGLACNDFDLRIEGWGGNRHFKEFTDKNGNVVRSLDAGTGSALRFTNLSNGETFSTKSNGAVAQRRYNSDGSYTETDTGHNLLILFPTDIPAGPSTTLIVGRVVFTVDSAFNFTVQTLSGKTTDICAAVSI